MPSSTKSSEQLGKEAKAKAEKEQNRDRQPVAGGASTASKAPKGNIGGNGLDRPSTLTNEGLPKGATPPGKLPPGLNPAKYSPNPTPSYEATPQNIATALATALTVGGTTAPALIGGEITGLTDTLGLGYEKPTGEVGGYDYDKSETTKAGAVNGMTTGQTMGPLLEKKKKKKNPEPGFTLLEGAGGTLLGT